MSGTTEPPQTDPRALDATVQDDHHPQGSSHEAGSLSSISRYLVIEMLGAGAMGVVLRAYDPRLRREVALKLLQRREDPEAEARMLREAQAMAQLSHPNVVGIYDAETTEHGVMIAMELVVGVPLDRWLKQGPRPTSEVLAAFCQAGRGLAAAHAAGLIHRDFKPANVFVGTDGYRSEVGRVRVGDFGLARETAPAIAEPPTGAESPAVDLTATGTVMGTPVYMAPEQHLGLPADERSDQFAFCVSLWEALHGERPFEGSHVLALAYAKQHGDLRPPRAKVPAAVGAAIRRGLSADPAERWPDLASLLQQLEPPRRRWGMLALVATITAAGVVTATALSAETTSPNQARCAAARQQLSATWNDERRGRLEASQRAPARLLDAFDAYSTRLRDQYDETCRPDDPPAPLRFDVTMACLDHRIQQIGATIELLSARPVHRDEHIDKLIDKLTPIDRCADTRWMGTRQTLPEDPALRAQVLELRDDLGQVKRLESEGRHAEARALADGTIARAEASGFTPVLASLLFARSSLAKAEGRYDDAARLVYRVLELRTAIGDEEGAFAAVLDLIFIRGVRQDHYDEADGWAALARGLMETTDIGPVRRGWFENHLGATMNARGRPEAAIEPLRRAVAELSAGLGTDHPRVADPLSHLTSALTALGRAEEALGPARRAVQLREARYSPKSRAMIAARLNLARALRETGAHAEALHGLRRALEPLDADEATAASRAAIWRDIAEIHERGGEPVAAAEARARAQGLRPSVEVLR